MVEEEGGLPTSCDLSKEVLIGGLIGGGGNEEDIG